MNKLNILNMVYTNGEDKHSMDYVERRPLFVSDTTVKYIELKRELCQTKRSIDEECFLRINRYIIEPRNAEIPQILKRVGNATEQVDISKVYTSKESDRTYYYPECIPYLLVDGVVHYKLRFLRLQEKRDELRISKFLEWPKKFIKVEEAIFVCSACGSTENLINENCVDCLYETHIDTFYD